MMYDTIHIMADNPSTDLQDALDRWDSERSEHVIRRQRGSDDVDLFVEAARLVADGIPTYLVFTRNDDVEYLGHIYQGKEAQRMADNPNLPGEWLVVIEPLGDTDERPNEVSLGRPT
jgi:hypothetical protein